MFLTNASQTWERRLGWPADPLWTESNWPASTPFIQVRAPLLPLLLPELPLVATALRKGQAAHRPFTLFPTCGLGAGRAHVRSQVLQRESASTEWAIFGGGIGACVLTALLSYWGRTAFEKHLKAL